MIKRRKGCKHAHTNDQPYPLPRVRNHFHSIFYQPFTFCSLAPVPENISCTLQKGGALSEDHINVGDLEGTTCMLECAHRRISTPGINGVSIINTPKCFCQIGMTEVVRGLGDITTPPAPQVGGFWKMFRPKVTVDSCIFQPRNGKLLAWFLD